VVERRAEDGVRLRRQRQQSAQRGRERPHVVAAEVGGHGDRQERQVEQVEGVQRPPRREEREEEEHRRIEGSHLRCREQWRAAQRVAVPEREMSRGERAHRVLVGRQEVGVQVEPVRALPEAAAPEEQPHRERRGGEGRGRGGERARAGRHGAGASF
jgi:hypothetical protein